MFKAVEKDVIFNANKSFTEILDKDYDYFCERISRLNINLESRKEKVSRFNVALPSWGVGTGGTRFARFPGIGEPQNIFEKIEDCAVINDLVGITSSVSPHFPWDDVDDYPALKQFTESYGINFDIVNSNTFQDPSKSKGSFKYGSLTHFDQSIREEAIKMNIDCIEKGITLGSKGLTVWIADGGNFPGQQNFSKSLERYVSSMQSIYTKLPEDWMILLEHKPYEPAFYSTVVNDWGTSYICAKELGEKAMCLVDLGHHLPNTNIEMIVSRLIGLKKLGGFHFNDSKFGDDDLDSGSINPFELFLIFNELTTGAGNDIEQATQIARKMVCEWGMSDVLGPMTFGKKNEEIFLGREIQSHRDFSEVTARMIDEEVVRIVRKAQSTAEKTLQDNSGLLENIANALLKFETIDGKEVETIMAGKTIKRLKNGSIKKPKSKSSKNTSKNNKQT